MGIKCENSLPHVGEGVPLGSTGTICGELPVHAGVSAFKPAVVAPLLVPSDSRTRGSSQLRKAMMMSIPIMSNKKGIGGLLTSHVVCGRQWLLPCLSCQLKKALFVSFLITPRIKLFH